MATHKKQATRAQLPAARAVDAGDEARELLSDIERELLSAVTRRTTHLGESFVVSDAKAPAAVDRALVALERAKLKGVRW